MRKTFIITILTLIALTAAVDVKSCLESKVGGVNSIFNKLNSGVSSIEGAVFSLKDYLSQEKTKTGLIDCLEEVNTDISGILNKVGLTFAYETNCTKDLGGLFLISSSLLDGIKNKDWENTIFLAISEVLIGKQTVTDCVGAFEAIKGLWTRKNLRR
mmetsp:Transcript_36322/g.37705  ORF Transcript_36322/g.37705 Transcript_36322/m.37705 type:complete len:157 (-) Transcript_36322:69-539(-)